MIREDIKINELASEYAEILVEKLETIMDPEIGRDIYNLGLIYEINLDENGRCKVVLTFTGAGCGCIDSVPAEIQQNLSEIEGINVVAVEIVWSPAWKITRISRFGRIALGVNPN